MKVSVITTIHVDCGERVRNIANMIDSLSSQDCEIVIAVQDGNSDTLTAISDGYVKLIDVPTPVFNMSYAFNVAAQVSVGEYLMFTGVDMIFSPNFISILLDKLADDSFVLAYMKALPKHVSVPSVKRNWKELLALTADIVPEKRFSVGACQAVSRRWFYKVRGYDEAFAGLGGMDDDMLCRARKDGLREIWIDWNDAQVLHQWHPRSALKGMSSRLFSADPVIVKNPLSWGGCRDVPGR